MSVTAVAVITSLLAALPLSEPSIQQHNVLNLDMSSLHDALLMVFCLEGWPHKRTVTD